MLQIFKQILNIDKTISSYLLISIILGSMLGISEIFFAYSLKEVLNYYNVVTLEKKWQIEFLSPIYLFIIFALVRLVISALTYFWQIYLAAYFKYTVKKNVISFLYSENQKYKISINNTSNLLSNISEKGSFCYHHFSSFLSQSFLILVNLIFLIIIDYQLFFICAFCLIFLTSPIYLLSKKLNKYAEIFKISNSEFIKKIFIDSRNILFLKISGALKKTSILQAELNNKSLKSQKDYQFKFSFLGQVPFFLGILIFFIILFVNKNFSNIDKGSLIIFIFLFFRICISAGNLITAQGNVKFHFPFLKEYKEILNNLDIKYDQKKGEKKVVPHKLITKNLIIHRGELKKEIPDIIINQGEIFSILGDSGTGKSTLILTLFGILKKNKGSIFWNDIDIENIDIDDFYKNISFCGTDPFLIKGNLRDNLFYGLSEDRGQYEEIKKLINICDANFLNEIKEDQKILDDEGTNFSSGQRQKIALIRALIKKPKILILDEATSNIDLSSEKKIIENILKEYPDIIIIATTHRPGILSSEHKIHLY